MNNILINVFILVSCILIYKSIKSKLSKKLCVVSRIALTLNFAHILYAVAKIYLGLILNIYNELAWWFNVGVQIFFVLVDFCTVIKKYIYIVHQLLILSPFSLMTLTNYIYLNWIFVLIGIILLAIGLKFISDKIFLIVDKIERLFVPYIIK